MPRIHSIADQTKAQPGFTSGFDYLRLTLSLSVLAFHTSAVCLGLAGAHLVTGSMWVAPVRLILPMFFALSGFLVASSLDRSKTIIEFLYLRGIRLVPALAVEISLSALLLGPLLTSVALSAYFSDYKFISYFGNIIGEIRFSLPGLFLHNPLPDVVNASLWTLRWELDSYLVLTAIALLGFARHPKRLLFAFVVSTLLIFFWPTNRTGPAAVQVVDGKILILFFVAGVVVNRWREALPYNFTIFLVSLISGFALLFNAKLAFFSTLPIAYATVYIGLTRPKRVPVLLSGDYSYGIYLYAFPIQQAIAQTITTKWYFHLPLSITLTFGLAAFSWRFVEKPMQRYKRALSNFRLPSLGAILARAPRTQEILLPETAILAAEETE
jgi:peptidoglycan/LPS O-acetylase OafA/YrhL